MIQLLYTAMEHPYGVKVKTDNAEALRQKLYRLRLDNLALFESISFLISPENGLDLWILKKGPPSE